MKTVFLLLTLSLLAIAPATNDSVDRQGDDDVQVSFNGTWKTIAGGTHLYTVILKQTGNEVTGSYSPGNGKIFDGVVSDKKLTFNWTQDGGYEGTAEFTMDQDGKGFTGSSTALKPKEFTNTWNTYKPPVTSFAGNWETISTGRYSIPLTIVQNGDRVTGIYPGNNGKIEGTVSGKVLRFKWESDGGSGSGRFVMEEGGQAFSGTYNKGDDPDEVDATWNGKRPPASFAGVWKAVAGTTPLTLTLQQTDSQVIGGYEADVVGASPISFREGIVVANTLRFKVARVDGTVFGSGEFVMDEGGKSFKGNISGAAITGTFARP